jgi:UDP-3-O-[3-hydroxymyristoyl] glucosamine N-acyltransferase
MSLEKALGWRGEPWTICLLGLILTLTLTWSCSFSRTAQIIGPALIGPRTHLSSNTIFRTSTIGRRSHVGSQTTIVDSYLFDHVTVGRDCVLRGCIVAQNVFIGDNVIIGNGALIGAGVRLGNGEVIPEFARVATTAFGANDGDSDEDDSFQEGKSDCDFDLYGNLVLISLLCTRIL